MVDFESQMLGLGDFAVIIDQACAGYEGMALVTGFLGLYLWVFRDVVRFPHALLLLPLGLAAIFSLNIVRIAVLVSIGAHFVAAVAIGGFHSQAGWMAFLGVTVGMMFVVPRLAFFAAIASAPRPLADDSERAMQAFVVPFMALMAGSIAIAALAPYDTGAYGLKIAAAGAALWVFRDVYRPLVERASGVAVSAGLLVGAVWIGTDPGGAAKPGDGLGEWIAAQPASLLAGWLVVRAVGALSSCRSSKNSRFADCSIAGLFRGISNGWRSRGCHGVRLRCHRGCSVCCTRGPSRGRWRASHSGC